MTTTPTSTDPVEDAAPVATEDAADATTATAAAGQGSSDEATHDEGGEGAEAAAAATAPAVEPRATPAGATDLADALRAARADQRRADGTETQVGATPAAAADAATTQRADPAHPELVQEAEPTDAPAAEPAAAEAAAAEAETPATYEAFVATLSEPQRKLVDEHITGLRGALQAERITVKKLEAQAKVAQALAEEKTRLEADVASVRSEAQLAQHRADFYENAIDQGVRRKSVRLAYLAALDAGHLNEDGTIAWDGIRAQFADLFEVPGRTSPTPPSRSSSAAAGAGSRGDTPAAPTLNQIIRNAAGRR